MRPLKAALLSATIRRAEELVLQASQEGAEDERPILAMAILHLRDAVAHYERCITWNVACQSCAALHEKLYAANRRGDEAESALLAHLAAHHVEEAKAKADG